MSSMVILLFTDMLTGSQCSIQSSMFSLQCIARSKLQTVNSDCSNI